MFVLFQMQSAWGETKLESSTLVIYYSANQNKQNDKRSCMIIQITIQNQRQAETLLQQIHRCEKLQSWIDSRPKTGRLYRPEACRLNSHRHAEYFVHISAHPTPPTILPRVFRWEDTEQIELREAKPQIHYRHQAAADQEQEKKKNRYMFLLSGFFRPKHIKNYPLFLRCLLDVRKKIAFNTEYIERVAPVDLIQQRWCRSRSITINVAPRPSLRLIREWPQQVVVDEQIRYMTLNQDTGVQILCGIQSIADFLLLQIFFSFVSQFGQGLSNKSLGLAEENIMIWVKDALFNNFSLIS